jgi:hypothetical protein
LTATRRRRPQPGRQLVRNGHRQAHTSWLSPVTAGRRRRQRKEELS